MPAGPRHALATRAIHGSTLKDAHGSPHLPVYNTTTFAFASTTALLDVVDGRAVGDGSTGNRALASGDLTDAPLQELFAAFHSFHGQTSGRPEPLSCPLG